MTTTGTRTALHVATVTDHDGTICARLIGPQQCADDCDPTNCEVEHEAEVG